MSIGILAIVKFVDFLLRCLGCFEYVKTLYNNGRNMTMKMVEGLESIQYNDSTKTSLSTNKHELSKKIRNLPGCNLEDEFQAMEH